MALVAKRPFAECLLELKGEAHEQAETNHIFEPEFHQDIYRNAGERAKKAKGAFQLGTPKLLERILTRGIQPTYVDDENDPSSLTYQGMVDHLGQAVSETATDNICALKSVSIRWGFVDFEVARSITSEFYEKHKGRAGVERNDLLINSTGDGTIGRVAVFNRDHKALVDGHITIVRLKDPTIAWYAAAYLLSQEGQRQIYRYINGSSGQVEIYPQDIERLWIPGKSVTEVKEITKRFKAAVAKYEKFQVEMASVLALAN